MHAGCLSWHQNSQRTPCCREAASCLAPHCAREACVGIAGGHSLSSCSSESMLVPVLGALLALSRSQFLYQSLGRGSFSVTAYSVPGVSQRSARGGDLFQEVISPWPFMLAHRGDHVDACCVCCGESGPVSQSVLCRLLWLHESRVKGYALPGQCHQADMLRCGHRQSNVNICFLSQECSNCLLYCHELQLCQRLPSSQEKHTRT